MITAPARWGKEENSRLWQGEEYDVLGGGAGGGMPAVKVGKTMQHIMATSISFGSDWNSKSNFSSTMRLGYVNTQGSDAQLRVTLPHREYLAMSGDSFGFPNWVGGEWDATDI